MFHGLIPLVCFYSELTSEIINPFRRVCRTCWWTVQHKKRRTYIHASSGIRTHDPIVQAVQYQRATDRVTTGLSSNNEINSIRTCERNCIYECM